MATYKQFYAICHKLQHLIACVDVYFGELSIFNIEVHVNVNLCSP